MAEFEHKPVMLAECIEGLCVKPDGIYLDGTAGGAGHSREIAKRLTTGKLFAVDKDPDAIAAAAQRLAGYRAQLLEGDFRDAPQLLDGLADGIDGALLDLGVSSHQLDAAERGFSHSQCGALDMRMSQRGLSAADIVNDAPQRELEEIIREYGEEKYASLIARRIVTERGTERIDTTERLRDIVLAAVPAEYRRKAKHPAKKTFMALRIAVNDELGALSEGLEGIFGLLKPGGRFAVMTFHSLEDRIVKRYFASLEVACTCPPDYPVCVCGGKAKAKAITRKPMTASEEELAENPRSHSAKLRVIEKL